MAVQKYLYLTEIEWVNNWVSGGDNIPVSLASRYRSKDRSSIYTPDENQIIEGDDLTVLEPAMRVRGANVFVARGTYNGQPLPNVSGTHYEDDGLIQSFSNSFDMSIGVRLRKKVCLKILDIEYLKECIDEQLQVAGIMKKCEYVPDHTRNHFKKSILDEWQDEFRIFWPNFYEEQIISLPSGIAEFHRYISPASRNRKCYCGSSLRFKHCHGQLT